MITFEKFSTVFRYTIGCIFGLIIGFFVGRYDIYMSKDCYANGKESVWYPHIYNMKSALYSERRLCNDAFEMLHLYYQCKDYEHYDDINDIYLGKHNFWDDVISESESYMDADSIMNHDWEDFFEEW